MRSLAAVFAVLTLIGPSAVDAAPFAPADIIRVDVINDPVFSPDGARIAYSLEVAHTKADKATNDIWLAYWNGKPAHQLTRTPNASEWQPAFSHDGTRIAFLSDRGKDSETQLWMIPADGGPARQITRITGGISDFTLSPDGRSAAVIAEVGGRIDAKAALSPPPIVITRFQFKEDGRDWLDARRTHIFRVDLASGKAVQLTQGDYDHWLPSWSPDGRSIAFVSRRDVDADRGFNYDVFTMPADGGAVRRMGAHSGADLNPDWDAGRPEWSPDSRRLAWVRAGDDKWLWYTPHQLAIGDVASGTVTSPASIDRWTYKPRWAGDGSIVALIEQDRDTWPARIDPDSGAITYLAQGPRFTSDFALSRNGRIALLDSDLRTPAMFRTPDGRALTGHNGWAADRDFAETRDISWASDGVTIHGMLTLPPGHRDGQRHPLIVRLHGGPVYQFSHEFMPDWQIYAAAGYAVLAVNPRGSSGRGFDYSRAIFADWGNVDVSDVKAGIDQAIALGIADPDRIGIGGWSYGGILTNYMIASDARIRAAVSGAGIANMFAGYGLDQYARDYELELGTPWSNADAYRRVSYPFLQASRISTPTLFLCAEKDVNVPCLGGEQMFQALKSRGVPTELVIYPGENHGLTVPSYRVDRMQRHLDWYTRQLAR